MKYTAEWKPTFCWECGRKLQRATRGPQKGQLVYDEIPTPGTPDNWPADNATVVVHKQCKPQ